MMFSTGIFALFLALALVLYWLAPVRARKYVMIGVGLVFYGYYLPKYLLLIGSMVAVTYLVARAMVGQRRQGDLASGADSVVQLDAKSVANQVADAGETDVESDAGDGNISNLAQTRLWMIIGVITCLLVLGYFKYWKMAAGTVNSLLAWMDWGITIPMPQILVPLGISYITFELIHYISDVYGGRIKPATVNAADLTLFIFFFPTMVSGPIKRYQLFQEQTATRLPFNQEMFFYGAYRVVLGLGKKFIIADTVGRLTTVLATPETAPPGMLVLGIYAYAVKIYFDFAGYSDMAIGISRMFGYRVPENFDRPYLQSNIAEFWRHWHMSLSSWIKDYIYIPLGGSRLGLPRTLVNLVLAFTLCGLWHGAAWNFVVWGAWHGIGLAVYRLWRTLKSGFSGITNAHTASGNNYSIRRFLTRAAGIFLTFHFVTAGWVLFAAPDLATAVEIFARCLALF